MISEEVMGNKGTCIYCNEIKQLSKEDFLPRGFGKFKGISALSDKICIQCNNRFQVFEGPFLQNSMIGFLRYVNGIDGRSKHDIHNPFQNRSYGIPPIKVTSKYPGEDYEVVIEIDKGTRHGREAKQLILKDVDGSTHNILLTDSIKTSDDLRSELERLNLIDAQPYRMFYSDAEAEWAKGLLKDIYPNIRFGESVKTSKDGDIINYTGKTEIDYSKDCRCISKIAFHYLLKHYPFFSGFEPEFSAIKNFIYSGGNPINFVASFNLESQNSSGKLGHIIAIDFVNGKIVVYIRLFWGIENSTALQIVNIGDNPLKNIILPMSGHFYSYYRIEDRDEFDGEIENISFPNLLQLLISPNRL